jgi:uncharacterized protein YecE (DUF72 family)
VSDRPQADHALHIGPAGWSYRDWVGPVYPKGRRIDQLRLIAKYFDTIELNSSFYRIPRRSLIESWVERLGERTGFRFTVKVWQRFTHERTAGRETYDDFISPFQPLIERDMIGAFLLQFPWSFRNTPAAREYLQRISEWFHVFPTAVELRHGSWNSDEALDLISGAGLSFCNIDQPLIGDSVPPTDHVTDPRLGYIRLHGRNRAAWFSKTAGRDERYNYLYREGELEGWAERARSLLSRVKDLFIVTNNHFRGQALVNAFQLKYLLEQRKQEMPDELVAAYPGLKDIASRIQGDLMDDLWE